MQESGHRVTNPGDRRRRLPVLRNDRESDILHNGPVLRARLSVDEAAGQGLLLHEHDSWRGTRKAVGQAGQESSHSNEWGCILRLAAWPTTEPPNQAQVDYRRRYKLQILK